jgi:hypothetical protein
MQKAGIVIAANLGLLLCTAQSVTAAPPRLIETAPGSRAWMSEAQIAELSEAAHLQGKCGSFIDVTDRPTVDPMYLTPLALDPNRVPTQQALIEPLLPRLSAANLSATVKALSS